MKDQVTVDVRWRSERQDWETPQHFFDALNDEFQFTLDACALPETAKVSRFYTPEDDALKQSWDGVVWMNPPYGYSIGKWIKKAHDESVKGATVVALIPARTDTSYWHEFVMKASEIRLVLGRLTFNGAPSPTPFPSAVIIFRPGAWDPTFTAIEQDNSK